MKGIDVGVRDSDMAGGSSRKCRWLSRPKNFACSSTGYSTGYPMIFLYPEAL